VGVHPLLRGLVFLIALGVLGKWTLAFYAGGSYKPLMSALGVAWVTGIFRRDLRLGILQGRGECEFATVNGVRVLHTSPIHKHIRTYGHTHAQLPVALDTWSARLLPSPSAFPDGVVDAVVFSMVLALVSGCGHLRTALHLVGDSVDPHPRAVCGDGDPVHS
jgi:hypothetical protein